MQKAVEGTTGFFRFLDESQALLQKKWEDHRVFCAAMFIMTGLITTSAWFFDYVTDPIGARHTIILRLMFFAPVLFPLYFKKIKSRFALEFIAITGTLALIVVYMVILRNLHSGMVYGIGGYTYFMFLPLLMYQGFSLRMNLFSTLLYAAFPHLLATIGFIPGFEQVRYAVLIWPAAVAMMLAHYAFAHNYRLRYESEVAMKLASHTDPLTGVSNRRHFMPLLQQEILRGHRFVHPVALMIMDIDHFKRINDTYGHPTGDLVICTLADICKHCSRQIDVVARLGGEEFGILLVEVGMQEALMIAERVRAAVEQTVVHSLVDGSPLSFTVSIGVAEQPYDQISEERLVNRADAALYQAKASGRNCVVGAKVEHISPMQKFIDESIRETE